MKNSAHNKSSADPAKRFSYWIPYSASFSMVIAATLLVLLIQENELINIALLYQLPVTLSAFWWGRWPSYFTAFTSILVFNFLFIPPTYTFSVEDARHLWSFATFLVVAFVIGGRTETLRNEAFSASNRERSTKALYQFSREIAAVTDLKTIITILATQVSDTLCQRTRIILPDDSGQLTIRADQNPSCRDSNFEPMCSDRLSDSEMAAAKWTYSSGLPSGPSTHTLPETAYLYLPMNSRESVVGLLAVHVDKDTIAAEQTQLLAAWAGLAAIAIERSRLMEKQREASLLLESDKLRTALLNSVSHELRTPLASIIGSVSTLLESDTLYSSQERHELLENIQDGANRMDRVVSNLLDSARLESGMVQLKMDWCDLEDVVGTALRRLREPLSSRTIHFKACTPLPMVWADSVLLEQVLINLIDNALKYSSPDTPIDIDISNAADMAVLSVSDRGIGIPVEELSNIFSKFYRVRRAEYRVDGTGLGLSICKGIIEAHGGAIWADNRPDGGTIVHFSLPSELRADSKLESGC